MEEVKIEKRFKFLICLNTCRDNHGLVTHERIPTEENHLRVIFVRKYFHLKVFLLNVRELKLGKNHVNATFLERNILTQVI